MNPVFIFVLIASIIGLVAVISILGEKERKRKITRQITDMGGSVTFSPPPDEQMEAARLATFVGGLPKGPSGIKMIAHVKLDGKQIAVVSHRYTTSSGKHTQVHNNTAACVECPSSWPACSMAPEGIFDRLGRVFGGQDIQLENADFNRAWRVRGDDEDFVLLLLTPELQQWLTAHGTGHTWQIKDGSLMVVSQRSPQPELLAALMHLLRDFMRQIPDMMWEYN